MLRVAYLAPFFLVCNGLLIRAQTPSLTASELMTAAQRREIGIDHMTNAERSALNSFLMDVMQKTYNLGLSKCGASGSSPTIPDCPRALDSYSAGGGHWIQDNSNGKVITLEDGSLWQIDSLDQIETVLWLPVTNITVIRDSAAVGDYKYMLLNKDDGEKAHAKYLGRE